ncbi:hypothetical protein HD806DRAFT_510041 [Xylariaceae sp. AK1471]|nr:hypothetical protein HD806DRAFT_510041 [Xylariaceae sp. AK1471]
MNIIITGATGFVGKEVVQQAIASEKIKHAFVLTRKALPDEISKNEKVTIIEHADFSTYPQEVISQLAGAEACIWAIGGRAPQFPDVETARKVSVDYTLAAAKTFLAELAPQLPLGHKFRFVFCSGKYAEWDEKKHLTFLSDTRHIKGQVEKSLCELADANDDRLEVLIARPGGILAKGGGRLKSVVAKMAGFIAVDHLARDFIRLAVDGHPERILAEDVLMAM